MRFELESVHLVITDHPYRLKSLVAKIGYLRLLFTRKVMSDPLRLHGLQHARLPCLESHELCLGLNLANSFSCWYDPGQETQPL